MTAEAKQLAEIESEIEKDVRAIWAGLLKIREQELYLADPQYKTWELYCQKRWGYGGRYVRQQLAFQRSLESGAAAPADTTEWAFRTEQRTHREEKQSTNSMNTGDREQNVAAPTAGSMTHLNGTDKMPLVRPATQLEMDQLIVKTRFKKFLRALSKVIPAKRSIKRFKV